MLICCIGSNERGVTIELGKVVMIGHPEGSKGWRGGESGSLPPMWLGFKSRRQRHMWVEFVVGSLLAPRGFFSGCSGFPLSSKTNIFKLKFYQESGRRRSTLWMCYLQIIINYLFIYSFICYNRSLIENR